MSHLQEEEQVRLSNLRPGLFSLKGTLWTKTDSLTGLAGVPVISVNGEQTYLAENVMVVPVTVLDSVQDRLAVAWMADLIARKTGEPEAVADYVLRAMGIPDQWTERQLRRWIKFGIDVGE